MTYEEMLEILRGKVLIGEDIATIQQRLNEIADVFEQTIRERDAAVEDIPRNCPSCKNSYLNNQDMEGICKYAEVCDIHGSKWEWRGVQDEL